MKFSPKTLLAAVALPAVVGLGRVGEAGVVALKEGGGGVTASRDRPLTRRAGVRGRNAHGVRPAAQRRRPRV